MQRGILHSATSIVGEHRRAFVALNLLYFGLVPAAMVVAAFNRPLQQTLLDAIGTAFTSGPLASVGNAYLGGEFLLAVVLTFGVNLIIGSFLSITLPSLMIPFSGLLVGFYRAALWGIIFSPTTIELTVPNVLSAIYLVGLLLLEGEAYVLTMLAAYVHGRAFLFPTRAGGAGRRQGYVIEVKQSARLYLLVIGFLILFGLKVMAEAGFIGDERCRDALDLLESKRLPDGGFPAEKKYYRVTDKGESGRSLVDWGGTSVQQMNEWVTTDALHVLKAAGRLV